MKNSFPPQKVLMTFARSFLTLEMARFWHAAGHQVFVVDSTSTHVSRFSNAVTKSFTLPSSRFKTEAYLNGLLNIIEQEKIDILIPIWEEIAYISKAIGRFPPSCKVFCPPFEVFHELQNKWLFQQKLKSLGIETLNARLVRSKEDLTQQDFSQTFALKPCYTRASQRIQKVSSDSRFPNIEIDPFNPWIAQEWADGNRFCTYSVCQGGKILAHTTYPVNYAIDGHSCLLFKAIEHSPIFKWIAHFVKLIDLTGQIAFDFIETADKRLYAIECNPRATSGLMLFSDQDRLDLSFLDSTSPPTFPKIGTRRQIAAGMLSYGWKKQAKPNRQIAEFLKELLTTKDVVYRSNDPLPLFAKPFVFANMWMKSRRLGLSIPAYFTYDYDWNGESLDHLCRT